MKDLSMYKMNFRVLYSLKSGEEPKCMSQNFYAQCYEEDFEEVLLDQKNKFLKMVSLRKDYKKVLDSKFCYRKLLSKSVEIVQVDKAILFKKKPYYT